MKSGRISAKTQDRELKTDQDKSPRFFEAYFSTVALPFTALGIK